MMQYTGRKTTWWLLRQLVTTAVASGCAVAYAAPLSNGTLLTLTPGVTDAAQSACLSGTCFGMEASPGMIVWTAMRPGTEGGFVIGKNQKTGGQEAEFGGSISAAGELTAGWSFGGNFGTFATAPFVGVFGQATTDALLNVFNDASCAGNACAGKTVLGTWHTAWNGLAVPMGSFGGCKSVNCTTNQKNGIFVSNWQVNADGTYVLDYSQVVPDGDPSGFGGVPYFLHAAGQIVPPSQQSRPLPNGTKLSVITGTLNSTQTACQSGSCFSMQIAPGYVLWFPLAAGSDGGIILGKNQTSGGQQGQNGGALATSGQLSAAWSAFGSYGTFATAPFSGFYAGNVNTGSSANVFDRVSCTGAGCVGKTNLGTWHVAWNGLAVPMGSASGCHSVNCTPNQLAGIGVSNWTVNPDFSYLLDYSWVVPDGDPSGFGGVPFALHLQGAVVPLPGPLPAGTQLSIARGTIDSTSTSCLSGSCLGMEITPGFVLWSSFGAGTDGGLIIGKNQTSGGQQAVASSATLDTPGQLSGAWSFFSQYGTFATAPMTGITAGQVTTNASANSFDRTSCSGAGCLGRTVLGTWHVAWNGLAVPMGSSGGCLSINCSPNQLAGIGVTSWTVNLDNTYMLEYSWVVPDGDPSGYGGIPFRMRMTGEVRDVAVGGVCAKQTPIASVTTVGSAQSTTINNTLSLKFTGRISSSSASQVTVCANTELQYEASATAGAPLCTVNGLPAPSSGAIRVNTSTGKLVCTNKPTGADTDRFRISPNLQ